MFEGRTLLIATKHGKEKVIAPIVEKELKVKCIVNQKYDTDELGTFSGEIDRKEDVFSTLKNKCLRAMEANNCDLAIASEGSFGAHPSMYFIPGNEEYLMLIDLKNNIEITAKELSVSTNFNAKYVENENELLEFAKDVHFPSHGLILKSGEKDFTMVHKGIIHQTELVHKYNEIAQKYKKVYVETDMRAHFNPTRMEVIKNTCLKLVEKVKNKCPNCATPGFDIKQINRGLPCNLCNTPTRSTLSVLYICCKCNYNKEVLFPNNKKNEDPMFCDHCNP
jgi:hypothetical protein